MSNGVNPYEPPSDHVARDDSEQPDSVSGSKNVIWFWVLIVVVSFSLLADLIAQYTVL